MKNFLFVCFILIQNLASAETNTSSASGRTWLLSKGAAAREAKRFTLQEWLANKEKNRMMDLWLNMNSDSPYEFIIGGNLNTYSLDTTARSFTQTQNYKNISADFSAYAEIVGLTAEYTNNSEENYNELLGMFNLRLFGNTMQGSHWSLHYGLRTRQSEHIYRLNQQFAASTLQIYLTKHFGIESQYRYFFPVTENYYGDTKGDSTSVGVFIEYGIVRIFGKWFQEKQESFKDDLKTNSIRTGTQVGLRFYL